VIDSHAWNFVLMYKLPNILTGEMSDVSGANKQQTADRLV